MTESPPLFDAIHFLKNLTSKPGIYRMFDQDEALLYVGKAGNLKKRVSSYFKKGPQPGKTVVMVNKIASIKITVTRTESEALLLENQIIKQMKPRYNILLRDDKSYPYIFLSKHQYPRLAFHRGAKRASGQYFGPYPGAGAVRNSLKLLKKLFEVRQCEDSYFQNRSRPCLQYQIKQCRAPCVGLISEENYQQDIMHTLLFLEGKSQRVIDTLIEKMEVASQALEFEMAARYRDQIASLRRVQETQYVSGERGNVDTIACRVIGRAACVQVFFIRNGQNLGNQIFYPKTPGECTEEDVISAFIPQYYLNRPIPDEVLISHDIEDVEVLKEALSAQVKHRVEITSKLRGDRAKWIKMALHNAQNELETHLSSQAGLEKRFLSLQQVLELAHSIKRMECFDISHTMGEATVASCVVFDRDGPRKSDYRRYNIENVIAGDDYHAMEQVLQRRYKRVVKGEVSMPDVVFIDGGKGQLKIAQNVFEELAIDDVTLVGVAKGAGRKPGLETLLIAPDYEPMSLSSDHLALHLIQQIRDEAHRFAITGHRLKRGKKRKTSVLEAVVGMGSVKRQRLLKAFGGLQEVRRASVDDIAKVNGINQALAQRIYDAFHE